jgi:transcriptional regulator GlxA family with amidase domain
MKTILFHLLETTRENTDSKSSGAGNEMAASLLEEKNECTRRIAASIDYMLQNLDKPLSVAGLAAAANISPSHFFALFRRCTGGAPIDFFIRLRMEQACHLLKTTSLNVKEIGATLGYDDPFYFSRAFKAVNHFSPTEYRRRAAPPDLSCNENTDKRTLKNHLLPKLLLSKVVYPGDLGKRDKINQKHSIIHSNGGSLMR